MENTELLFEGSVKNVLRIPESGDFIFEYSDRFSVFDWGAMPDTLDGKGVALASMANFFFNLLGNKKTWKTWDICESASSFKNLSLYKQFCNEGIKHHGIGLGESSNHYKIRPVDIIKPDYLGKGEWDYSQYNSSPEECLVPLEVIFRFGVPRGSSLLKRTTNSEYVKELGLAQAPLIGERFSKPIIEFSTKLEPSDKFVNYNESKLLAGLSQSEFDELFDFVSLVSLRIKDIFREIDIELWDGKLEFSFGKRKKDGNRSFKLVDSIGPDELRLMYKGTQLSKETLRTFYRQSDWYKSVERSKKLADERGEKNWKDVCLSEFNISPPILDLELKNACEEMYKCLAQDLNLKFNGKKIYDSCWSLDKVVKMIKNEAR